MLIGPAIFTLTFAQFAGPWRSLGLIGAPWLLAAMLYTVALVIAWRVTSRADDVVLPRPSRRRRFTPKAKRFQASGKTTIGLTIA